MASPGYSANAQVVEPEVLVPPQPWDYPRQQAGSTKMASPGYSAGARVVEPEVLVPPQP